MYDDLFGLLKPIDLWVNGSFERDYPEVKRYKTYVNKDGVEILSINTIGLDKKDIKVSYNNNCIHIVGKTINTEINTTSSIDYTYTVDEDSACDLDHLNWSNKDGYTYIYLYFKKKAKAKNIEVPYKD